ncbi:MlaD family protein [Saccharopolyspora endophytica]|uniref:MCE family protein n=1 Tax=Saccharopolyspora endophytica TaxID=543886 RepID=A0ABS5DB75_9PSEU|nr:MlaD family protein [Saccharopolyspora endophytica]MBQ0923536.1 MCE family protein [Saccharopolyspora endophytica]
MRFFQGTAGKLVVLGTFFVLSMVYMGYLLDKAGVTNPLANSQSYTASFETSDVDNAIPVGDVKVAGVNVGKIDSVEHANGKAQVVVSLEQQAAPLHEGAKVRIGAKSLAGESYIEIEDGKGEELPSGSRIPPEAVERGVQLRDVVNSLDPKTRAALGGVIRTAGEGTTGSKEDVASAMTGLGQLGRQGYTAVDAISAQSKDLTTLAQQTTTVLDALDTGQGQIASLVENAQRLTSATSGQQEDLAATVRSLPGVLSSTQTATGKLHELSSSVAPVASDLKTAAPYLNSSLQQLPQTTSDLRGLLPGLNGTLHQAPDTLDRLPVTAQDVSALVPQARTAMTNLNPMLSYIKPYGPELGAFFANFGSIFQYTDEAGIHFFRLMPDLGNEGIVKGVPAPLPNVLTNSNPYPAPGQSVSPEGREFTRIHPQPN